MCASIFNNQPSMAAIKEANEHPVFNVFMDYTYEIPAYNDRDYAIMANQDINRRVLLPSSRQHYESEWVLSRVTHLSRSIEQRIGAGRNTKWENLVRIYNFFADELGYEKITAHKTKMLTPKPKPMRMWDEKTGSGTRTENMVYMSDGMWIAEEDCWW
jgi:hypothetical protein